MELLTVRMGRIRAQATDVKSINIRVNEAMPKECALVRTVASKSLSSLLRIKSSDGLSGGRPGEWSCDSKGLFFLYEFL
jgi:hypothetical protein